MLPTKDNLKNPPDSDGDLVLTEYEYDLLVEEAIISAHELDLINGTGFDIEDYAEKWITKHLGTDLWYSSSSEQDDLYKADKYH